MEKRNQTHSPPASVLAASPSIHQSPTSNRSPSRTKAVATYEGKGQREERERRRESADSPKLHKVTAAVLASVHLGVDLRRVETVNNEKKKEKGRFDARLRCPLPFR